MSEKTKANNTASPVPFWQTAAAPFINKYAVMMIISVIMTFLTAASEQMRYSPVAADTLAAAVICLAGWFIQYVRLKKFGVTRKAAEENRKNIDPRLTGTLGDAGGIGSTLGALAGISVILSRIFISEGGMSGEISTVFPVIEAIAEGLCIAAVISSATAGFSIRCSLYVIAAKTFNAGGDELLKKACRSAHSEETVKRLGRMYFIRVFTAIALSLVTVICALCGMGAVLSCWQTAFICMAAAVLSETGSKCSETGFAEEKLPLFGRLYSKMCTVNVLFFLLISFAFLFSFPIRSVYTEYVSETKFFYEDSAPEETEQFLDIPLKDSSTMPLFNGFFLTCCLIAAVVSGSYSLRGSFESPAQLAGELLFMLLSFAASFLWGIADSTAALDFLQYTVTLSAACLMIIVNLMAYLIFTRNREG